MPFFKLFLSVSLIFNIFANSDTTAEAKDALNAFKNVNKIVGGPQSTCAHTKSVTSEKSQKLKKVLIGLKTKCKNIKDVQKYGQAGLYKISDPKVTVLSNGKFKVHTDVFHFECRKVNGKFKLSKVDDPFNYSYDNYKIKNGKVVKEKVYIKKVADKLSIERDGLSKSLSVNILKKSELGSSTDVDIDVKKILTKSEYKRLQKGESLKIPLDFGKFGYASYLDANGKRLSMGLQRSGAFRIKFDIKMVDGKLMVGPSSK